MTEPLHAPSESQRLADQLAESAITERETVRAARIAVPSRVTRERVVYVALALAVPILLGVLLATFAWQPLMALFEPAPSPAMARQQAQEMLDALVGEVDAFRRDYDVLPATLVEVGVPPRGQWSYTAFGDAHYKIECSCYGQIVRFDSTLAKPKPAGGQQ